MLAASTAGLGETVAAQHVLEDGLLLQDGGFGRDQRACWSEAISGLGAHHFNGRQGADFHLASCCRYTVSAKGASALRFTSTSPLALTSSQ